MISSVKRSKELVFPRQIVMYLCGDMTSGLSNIGKALGGRDHTTIIHGTKKIASELKTDENLKKYDRYFKEKSTRSRRVYCNFECAKRLCGFFRGNPLKICG